MAGIPVPAKPCFQLLYDMRHLFFGAGILFLLVNKLDDNYFSDSFQIALRSEFQLP